MKFLIFSIVIFLVLMALCKTQYEFFDNNTQYEYTQETGKRPDCKTPTKCTLNVTSWMCDGVSSPTVAQVSDTDNGNDLQCIFDNLDDAKNVCNQIQNCGGFYKASNGKYYIRTNDEIDNSSSNYSTDYLFKRMVVTPPPTTAPTTAPPTTAPTTAPPTTDPTTAPPTTAPISPPTTTCPQLNTPRCYNQPNFVQDPDNSDKICDITITDCNNAPTPIPSGVSSSGDSSGNQCIVSNKEDAMKLCNKIITPDDPSKSCGGIVRNSDDSFVLRSKREMGGNSSTHKSNICEKDGEGWIKPSPLSPPVSPSSPPSTTRTPIVTVPADLITFSDCINENENQEELVKYYNSLPAVSIIGATKKDDGIYCSTATGKMIPVKEYVSLLGLNNTAVLSNYEKYGCIKANKTPDIINDVNSVTSQTPVQVNLQPDELYKCNTPAPTTLPTPSPPPSTTSPSSTDSVNMNLAPNPVSTSSGSKPINTPPSMTNPEMKLIKQIWNALINFLKNFWLAIVKFFNEHTSSSSSSGSPQLTNAQKTNEILSDDAVGSVVDADDYVSRI